jgi:hypothetical protein
VRDVSCAKTSSGWGQAPERRTQMARVYNWWNIFVRLAEPDKHREAIASRPLRLAGIAERTRPYPPPINANHSSSLNTATPSSVALSSFDPASAPAIT